MFGRNKKKDQWTEKNVGKAITQIYQKIALLDKKHIDNTDCMETLDRFFPRCDLCHYRWPVVTIRRGTYISDPVGGKYLRQSRVCVACCKSLAVSKSKKKKGKKK